MFTLAHFSDVHLGPLPRGAAWRDFALKRPVGYLSWRLKRHRLHVTAIADAIAADIAAAAPDHVAFTGDIVNISARDEFPAAALWLARFGAPKRVSFVPGNHDTYVRFGWEHGLGHLAPYMTGDMRVAKTQATAQIASPFPFVRLRKNVALIGLCSALPQPLHKAAGRLGALQLESAALLLRDLRERGYYRCVLIHHPPLPGMAPPRKALADAARFRDILANEGAELVLHGHNHTHSLVALPSRFGTVNVVGVTSASMGETRHYKPAAWHRYAVTRESGRWHTALTVRAWDPAIRGIRTAAEFALSP
ncbi:MAG: metallophosphoesterase family protein [Hyphomicrobiales bacterium]